MPLPCLFHAAIVRSTSFYTYPTTYAKRSLPPVSQYAGTPTFQTIDISGTISSSILKIVGGVLGSNGKIYFVAFVPGNIGVFVPSRGPSESSTSPPPSREARTVQECWLPTAGSTFCLLSPTASGSWIKLRGLCCEHGDAGRS